MEKGEKRKVERGKELYIPRNGPSIPDAIFLHPACRHKQRDLLNRGTETLTQHLTSSLPFLEVLVGWQIERPSRGPLPSLHFRSSMVKGKTEGSMLDSMSKSGLDSWRQGHAGWYLCIDCRQSRDDDRDDDLTPPKPHRWRFATVKLLIRWKDQLNSSCSTTWRVSSAWYIRDENGPMRQLSLKKLKTRGWLDFLFFYYNGPTFAIAANKWYIARLSHLIPAFFFPMPFLTCFRRWGSNRTACGAHTVPGKRQGTPILCNATFKLTTL